MHRLSLNDLLTYCQALLIEPPSCSLCIWIPLTILANNLVENVQHISAMNIPNES